MSDGNGKLTSISYDSPGRKTSMSAPTMGGWSYGYDVNGNMTAAGANSFAWDGESQLASVTVSGVGESYAYDADNERVKRTRSGLSTYYIGGVYEEDSNGTTRTYYQLNGRVVAQRENAPLPPTPTNTPRPTNTPMDGGCAGCVPTQPLDRSSAPTSTPTATPTHSKGMASWTATKAAGKGGAQPTGTPAAVGKGQPTGPASGGTMRDSVLPPGTTSTLIYLHGDHLGSVSTVTSASGAQVSMQEFDPWGKIFYAGVGQTRLSYTGQQRDDTGLLYYHARYYDPRLARFISPDSIVPRAASGVAGAGGTVGAWQNSTLTVDFHETKFVSHLQRETAKTLSEGFAFQQEQPQTSPGPQNPQALNRYAYTLNNLLKYSDPTGHHYVHISYEAYADYRASLERRWGDRVVGEGLVGGGAVLVGGAWICGPAAPACAVGAGLLALGVGGYSAFQMNERDEFLGRMDAAAAAAGPGGRVEVVYDHQTGRMAIYGRDKDGRTVYRRDVDPSLMGKDTAMGMVHDVAMEEQARLPANRRKEITGRR